MRWVIPCLFFLSGACGLVYQVVWARMLTVVFGATLLAVSTVLSAFMAGLALGSFVFGRYIDRVDRPLRVFALLEAGVGSYALLFPTLAREIGSSAALLQTLDPESGVLYPTLRFLISFVLLLIPTSLMGATLPVLSKFVVRRLSGVGVGVGWLYGINTLGAVAGVVTITFFLMEALGLQASTYSVAAVNFVVAALALLLDRRQLQDEAGPTEAVPEPAADVSTNDPIPRHLITIVIVGFALSGFAALGYEVAWLRLFIVAFSVNTHYEFSIILIAFLLGISLGSFACSRYMKANRDLLTLFGIMEVLIGIMGICSVFLFIWSSEWIGFIQHAQEWWRYRLGIFAVSFTIMFVPTFLMGALFPVVSRINTRQLSLLGRGVGDVYAVNSLGAIGGAFATGFLLIPAFGTEGTFKALGLINLTAGLIVLLLHPGIRPPRRKKTMVGATLVIAFLVLTLAPDDILRTIAEPRDPERKLAYYSEGREGVVTVISKPGYRMLQFNRGGQVPTDYSSFQLFRLLGHLPLLLHSDPQDVLVVALGGGIALGAVAQHDLALVECVEIVPDVVEAARQEYGSFNHDVLDRLDELPVRVIVDDGRNYLLTTDRNYDVITGDATHPTSTDSWVLYTRDFYELCRAHLNDDGIFVQWLPFHGMHVDDFKTVLRTFHAAFPHATLWRTNNYAIMVGTTQPLSVDVDVLSKKFDRLKVRESLDEVDLGTPIDVLSCFLFDEVSFAGYVGEGPINTDDHPHLSFAGRRGFRADVWRGLGDLQRHLESTPVALETYLKFPTADRRDAMLPRLATYLEGKRHVLEGDVLRLKHEKRDALAAYGRAVRLNPGEKTAQHYYHLLGAPLVREYRREHGTDPPPFFF
jgi:spermidine synthase